MIIKKFSIINYRAIDKIEFDLNFSINPIVGINEAGKTTVLRAILAFDRTRDKFNGGEHLDYKNKYVINAKPCTIGVTITLDTAEIKELISRLSVKTDSEDYKTLKKFDSKTEFVLTRHLSSQNKHYLAEIDGLSSKPLDALCNFLVSKLPYILYFDDFADRVPDEVTFPTDYPHTQKLGKGKGRDWQEIIQEIFKRAETEEIGEEDETPLVSYLQVKNADTKSDILSDVQDTLNKEIINEWKRIKKSGNSFADDSDKLELVIVNDDNTFKFKVKDKSNQDKSRTFDISERSKGFQWFFNYMIKLKFNPNYKGKLENCFFLLDEPGSYLHSSAQSELLKELQNVSKKNTIIYCTHSQYLLNPDIIKLGSIKIAEKKKSIITLTNFGDFKTSNDRGALSPIYQALQLNFAHDFVGKLVITEGIIDFYFFSLLQKHSNLLSSNIRIIPGSGASQSSTLISLAIPFSADFVILLDHDKPGRQAAKTYIKEFGAAIEKKILFYNDSKDFVLEDFLSEDDKKRLLDLTNSTQIKRAFGFLYYDYKGSQKEFIKNLSKETLQNLSIVLDRIKLLEHQ